MTTKILSSKWGGLNRALLASIYPVTAQGEPDAGPEVQAPPSDGNVELSANWQSPFENTGAESKIPAIAGMLQTGTLQSYVETLIGKGSDDGYIARIAQEIVEFSKEGQGRSGMTKLNSTQVFTGAGPVKIPLTLHFRAFDDPASEVLAPINQLAQWTLARQLAANGSLVQAIQNFRQGQGFLKSLLPSQSPQMVAFRFGGYLHAPMVIESMNMPINVPRSAKGQPLNVAVQLVLSTISAMDSNDWSRAQQGRPIQLFNN